MVLFAPKREEIPIEIPPGLCYNRNIDTPRIELGEYPVTRTIKMKATPKKVGPDLSKLLWRGTRRVLWVIRRISRHWATGLN